MNTNAFTAIVTLHTPGTLLGGGRSHVSAPFADRHDAVSWAEQSIQANRRRNGHSLDVITYDVVPVFSYDAIPSTGKAFERTAEQAEYSIQNQIWEPSDDR